LKIGFESYRPESQDIRLSVIRPVAVLHDSVRGFWNDFGTVLAHPLRSKILRAGYLLLASVELIVLGGEVSKTPPI
jgi:hypothetical protein